MKSEPLLIERLRPAEGRLMQLVKLSCPQCRYPDQYALNRWGGCKSCGLLIYLDKLTPRFFELQTARIEDDSFNRKDSGKVFFIRHKGDVIHIHSDHNTDIENFTFDQYPFDENLLQWENRKKGIDDKGYSTLPSYLPKAKLDPAFWQTGYDITREVYKPGIVSGREVQRNYKGRLSDKELQKYTKKVLEPEFYLMGLLRSKNPDGFYTSAPREPGEPLLDRIREHPIVAFIFALVCALVIVGIVTVLYLIFFAI